MARKASVETGDLSGLVRVVKRGPRFGAFGRIVEKTKDMSTLYQVEFPGQGAIVYFFEDELEKVTEMPCPDCIREGIPLNGLTEPQHSSEGWGQECPAHGKLFLWGWYTFHQLFQKGS
jgi:hypothetical protein